MKTAAKLIVFMCALASAGGSALGQITITASDVATALTIGDSLANKYDTLTSVLDIGQIGATSWDFHALRSDSALTLTSIPLAGTPFLSHFPSATHVFQANLTVVYSGAPIAATGYLYFQMTTDMLNLGEGATALGGLATLTGTNVPAEVYYHLPLTLGTTWTTTYLDTTDIIALGSLQSATGTRHNATYLVDAYGLMTIPGGSVYDALRIKSVDTITTYTSGVPKTGVSVGYIFLAKNFASVQVTALGPGEPDHGVINLQVRSTSWNARVDALPIQLSSFTASLNASGAGALLRWRTLSEVNNYGFDVQRGASSAGEFATLPGAFIPGHGTTTAPCDYSYVDAAAPAGTWYYRLKQIDLDGAVHYSDPARTDVAVAGTVNDVPAAFSLGQNFPNPFNPETTIRYGLPAASNVDLAVYTVLGERVAVLFSGPQGAGFHEVRFDGSALASGVYFYRLKAGNYVESKKLTLLR